MSRYTVSAEVATGILIVNTSRHSVVAYTEFCDAALCDAALGTLYATADCLTVFTTSVPIVTSAETVYLDVTYRVVDEALMF